jgi:putative membrane protein
MKLTLSHKLSLILVTAVFVVSWIQPHWPTEQALQSTLTVAGLISLVWYSKRYGMNNFDFAAICFFMAVHCVAARWLYSYVPYDEWFKSSVDWSPQTAFGFERNHFDRLIHFLYGVCFIRAISHFIGMKYQTTIGIAATIGVMLVMCSSLAYEWFEWGIALTLSPAQAEAYNGQQGDIWDAHMDMLLATIGACLMIPFLRHKHGVFTATP